MEINNAQGSINWGGVMTPGGGRGWAEVAGTGRWGQGLGLGDLPGLIQQAL